MNAAALRLFLNMAVGQKADIQPRVPPPPALHSGAPTAAANGTRLLFYPISVAANLVAGALEIRNAAVPGNDGVFIPDDLNQCTRATSIGSNGIMISGRFNGCTFLRWENAGVLHVGHVFVDATLGVANNPGAQIAAFRVAIGAPVGAIRGFSTIGQIPGGAQFGYVIALQLAGVWEFHWLTVTAPGIVVARRQLGAPDWVVV